MTLNPKHIIVAGVLCLLLTPFSIFSQEVVSPAGEQQKSESIDISWTIGESIIETQSNDEKITLTQGFEQPHLKVEPILEEEEAEPLVNVFPNPFSSTIIIEVLEYEDGEFESVLFDMSGEEKMRMALAGQKSVISMEEIAAAPYILKVYRSKKEISSFKVIRIN